MAENRCFASDFLFLGRSAKSYKIRNRYTHLYIYIYAFGLHWAGMPEEWERERGRDPAERAHRFIYNVQSTVILCVHVQPRAYTHALSFASHGFITPKNINRNGPKYYRQWLSHNGTAIYLLFYYGHTHSRTHNALAGEEDVGKKSIYVLCHPLCGKKGTKSMPTASFAQASSMFSF